MSSQVEHNQHESVKMLMQSGSFFFFFSFFGLWGLWLQSASIFSKEVSCCKWKLSIGSIYPLFLFSPHLLLFFIFSLLFLLSSVQSVHVFFPFCCLSFPSSVSLCPFVLFSHFLSFPLSLISILSLSPPHTHTLSLSLLSLVFPSSALGTARQTGQ